MNWVECSCCAEADNLVIIKNEVINSKKDKYILFKVQSEVPGK